MIFYFDFMNNPNQGKQPPPQKKCPKSGKGGLKYGLDSDDTNIWRNIGEMNAKFGTYMTDI